MEQMKPRIAFAVFLGIIVGCAIGYSPPIQPAASAPRPLLMQETAQPNLAFNPLHASANPVELVLALAVALEVAIPVFLVSKAKAK